MASTSNESLYCFLAVARKAGIPSVCSQQVCGWLMSSNTYVFEMARKIVQVWEEKNPWNYADGVEPWRSQLNWRYEGIRGSRKPKIIEGSTKYELKLYYTFNDCVACARWNKREPKKIVGKYELMPETIRQLYMAFHRYSSKDKSFEVGRLFDQLEDVTGFDQYELLPFAAFLAGVAWNGEIFFNDAPVKSKGNLGHFLIMGILASENEKPLDLPGWAHKDENLLWDIFEYLLHPRMPDFLAKFEEMLDLSRTSLFFATRLLTKCVQDARYTKQLELRTRLNHGLLMKVLQILIVHEVGYSVIMKFECMVVLHTQKESFRTAFAQAVRKRKYTA